MQVNHIKLPQHQKAITNKNFPIQTKFPRLTFYKNLPSVDCYYKHSFKSSNNLLPFDNKGYDIDYLIESAQTNENILGQGANSIVYDIPQLDNYVLKVLNKDDINQIIIGEIPSNINLGQPIWQSKENPRLLILNKIKGKAHSINNWSKTIWDSENYSPRQITKEQANLFYNQLSELAKMPQKTYEQLTNDVKILEEKNYKVDSINPNNLIVDIEKKQIHIIDYFKVKPHEKDIYKNSYMDLVAIILDFTLFPEYFDKIDDKKKIKMLQNIQTIQQKIYKAAQKTGLSLDEENFKTYINATSRWFTAHSVPNEKTGGIYFRYYDVRLKDFLNMLKNPIEWAKLR